MSPAPPVFYLACLKLLLEGMHRPRVWVRVRSSGYATHAIGWEGLFHAEVSGNRSSDWVLVTDVLTFEDGKVWRVRRSAALPGCRDPRPAKRALLAELDQRLADLRTALLGQTGMSPAAAQVFAAMCRNDWRLGGDDLVAAAQAAKASVG